MQAPKLDINTVGNLKESKMKMQAPKTSKNCCTCAKWGGGRGADTTRTIAIFESDQKGECLGGGWNYIKVEPFATCGQWERWSALD